MKLLRVGQHGQEKVAAMDSKNKIRDLSSHIDDLNPDTINFKTLEKLQKIKIEQNNISALIFSFIPKDTKKNNKKNSLMLQIFLDKSSANL